MLSWKRENIDQIFSESLTFSSNQAIPEADDQSNDTVQSISMDP